MNGTFFLVCLLLGWHPQLGVNGKASSDIIQQLRFTSGDMNSFWKKNIWGLHKEYLLKYIFYILLVSQWYLRPLSVVQFPPIPHPFPTIVYCSIGCTILTGCTNRSHQLLELCHLSLCFITRKTIIVLDISRCFHFREMACLYCIYNSQLRLPWSFQILEYLKPTSLLRVLMTFSAESKKLC